jgi:hypothetical protein
MSQIVLVDTCIFLNILDVPSFNQHRVAVLTALKNYVVTSSTSLLLPMIAIVEAGNHIAQLSSGGHRRIFAAKFANEVSKAMTGDSPWRAMRMPESEIILRWLPEFPGHAMCGTGMGDLSIIKDWEATCAMHAGHRVTIWSLDHNLEGYDRGPLV